LNVLFELDAMQKVIIDIMLVKATTNYVMIAIDVLFCIVNGKFVLKLLMK